MLNIWRLIFVLEKQCTVFPESDGGGELYRRTRILSPKTILLAQSYFSSARFPGGTLLIGICSLQFIPFPRYASYLDAFTIVFLALLAINAPSLFPKQVYSTKQQQKGLSSTQKTYTKTKFSRVILHLYQYDNRDI